MQDGPHKPREATPQVQAFRVKPISLGLPKEWTSGSVSELLGMLEAREYLAKIIDPEFLECLASVHQKYLQLVSMEPVDRLSIPKGRKVSGIYLFSEGEVHFYIGRTTNLLQRLRSFFRAQPSCICFQVSQARDEQHRGELCR